MKGSLRIAALLVGTAVAAGNLTLAQADTLPSGDSTATASADSLPTVQIENGVVWTQEIVGDRVFVGGEFDSVRPAGAAPGENVVARSHLLSYDIHTGELTDFAPDINAKVLDIQPSADGSVIFVVGNFTSINGVNRYRIAALDPDTGEVIRSFNPTFNYRARTMVLVDNTLYVGGGFGQSSGNSRTRLAAFDATTGALLNWAPSADREVMSLTYAAGRIIAGGQFLTLNGEDAYGMGALDPITGEVVEWQANQFLRNGGPRGAITALHFDGNLVYGTGYTYGRSGGNMEGAFAAHPDDGRIEWIEDCHGDTYSVHQQNGAVYVAGHMHFCGSLDKGFLQTYPDWQYQHVMAVSADTRGTLKPNSEAEWRYTDFGGQPAPEMLHFYPTFEPGTYTGQEQAVWHLTGNDDYVLMAGEFPTTNGEFQAGLARFPVNDDQSPHQRGPETEPWRLQPSLTSPGTGVVRGAVAESWDMDNEMLTYRIIRDGDTEILNTERASLFRNPRTVTWTDRSATPGQQHSYHVEISDGHGNVVVGESASIVVAADEALSQYADAVLTDDPQVWWRFDEESGVPDSAGVNPAISGTGVNLGAESAMKDGSGRAAEFDTGLEANVAATSSETGRDTFTAETWINTKSKSGGRILGFGLHQTGDSTHRRYDRYDRHLYMTDSGRIAFGVDPLEKHTVQSNDSYNDGEWHHVAATLGQGGVKLYVDGKLKASDETVTSANPFIGYWRVGGDTLANWPSTPTDIALQGTYDEVAIYPTELSESRIATHYAAAGWGEPPANVAPTAEFSANSDDLTVSLDASAATDSDGSITSYEWDLGDGNTATGVTTEHTYAAAGDYTITLTVTDNDGATDTTDSTVTVTEPPAPEFLVDELFQRIVSNGWGESAAGFFWNHNRAGDFSVDGEYGQVTTTPGHTRRALLDGAESNQTVIRTDLAVSEAQNGSGGHFVTVFGRRLDGANWYEGRVKVTANEEVTLRLSRRVGGTNTTLGSVKLLGPDSQPLKYTAGDKLNVEFALIGTGTTELGLKVWADNQAEPSEWQLSATDNSPELQAAGQVGIQSYLSSSSQSSSQTVSIDRFRVTSLDN